MFSVYLGEYILARQWLSLGLKAKHSTNEGQWEQLSLSFPLTLPLSASLSLVSAHGICEHA